MDIKQFAKDKVSTIDKTFIMRTILFVIVTVGLLLKSFIFLGFTLNENIYSLNFSLGYNEGTYFYKYYLAFILAFLSFYFLFKNRGKLRFLFIMDIFLTLIIAVDLWYYRGFRTVPSLIIIKQTANLDNLTSSTLSMMSPLDILLFIDIILFILLWIKLKPVYKEAKRSVSLFILTFVISVGFIAYVPFVTNVLKKDHSKSYIYGMYDPNDTTVYFSPIGYHVFNAYQVYRDSKPLDLKAEEVNEIKEWYNYKNENLPDNEYKGKFAGKNLVVLQVESLESFVIGEKVNGEEITPNLNKLLSNSIYFPHIKEQVNEGTSSDSDLMVNASVFPLRQGSTFFSYPVTTYNSMPKLLKELGYENLAIHPDKGPFWNWMEGLKGVGFDNLIDYYSFDDDESIGLGISDRTYLKQIVPKLADLKEPFYSFMVTLTSHGPFDLPAEYREMKLPDEIENNILGDYFQSIHYTDEQIGMFVDLLDQEGLLDNTVIAITGDHTGIHKYYTDKLATLNNPKQSWMDITWDIPLMIYDKNSDSGKTFDTIGGQIDTMPTLAYLMGIDENKYINSAMGRNLLNTKKSFAVLTNRTVLGDVSEEDKEHAIKGLDLADKIIKSNYFEKYYKK